MTPSPITAEESLNRVEYDDNGHLDEIVTDGGAHLECLDRDKKGGKDWFLSCRRADGSSVGVWIYGRVSMMEERPAPETQKPAR